MTSAQEAPPPQTVSAALFESVKNYFYVSLKKKPIFYVVVFHRWSLLKRINTVI